MGIGRRESNRQGGLVLMREPKGSITKVVNAMIIIDAHYGTVIKNRYEHEVTMTDDGFIFIADKRLGKVV